MKKLIFVIFLVLPFTFQAQEGIIPEVSNLEELVVHYGKELIENTKMAIGEAAEFLVEEGTIVVKQYLMFEAIRHLVPLVFVIFLLFYIRYKLPKYFAIKKKEAIMHNNHVDLELKKEEEDTDKLFSDIKEKKYIHFAGNYYRSVIVGISHNLINIIGIYFSVILVISHFLIFIKVAFFPKLYLVEVLTKYLGVV